MASTYSSNLRLELIASGQQANTWGNTTNTNLGTLLEQAITGVTDVDISSGDVTLTALNGAYDQSRGAILSVTGASGATRTVFTQANVSKVYIVDNSSTVDVVLKTLASGTPVGVTIPAGTAKLVYTDGTDYWEGNNAADVFTATDINATDITADTVTITGTPTASTDATTVGAVNTAVNALLTAYLPKAGGTMSGAINMGTNKITGLGTPTVSTDAATMAYVDTVAGGAGIPSGTRMIFAQASPPTGWTQVTTYNNYAMRIVSGSGGGTGGSVGFTTAFTSQTPSGSVTLSGNTGSHILTAAQMPSHKHNSNQGAFVVSGNTSNPQTWVGGGGYFSLYFETGSAGGDQGHDHPIGGSATFAGSAINLAVQYLDVIIASKN